MQFVGNPSIVCAQNCVHTETARCPIRPSVPCVPLKAHVHLAPVDKNRKRYSSRPTCVTSFCHTDTSVACFTKCEH